MQITSVSIKDAFVCESARYYDNRGFFQELFSQKYLPSFVIAQVNCSLSEKNVVRGLHIVPFAKLVHCIRGKIFDVVADLRPDSKTYLQWYGIELSGENQKALFIPPNCGHGFLSLADDSMVVYAQDHVYDPALETSIRYDDPQLNIKWPWAIVSEKDLKAPTIHSCDDKG